MSLNWVMRAPDGVSPPFVLLEGESVKYQSGENVEIKLKAVQLEKPDIISIKGPIFLTSRRLVILSEKKLSKSAGSDEYDNFSLLYKDIISYKLEMPWFGSNSYKLLFKVTNDKSGLNYLYTWNCSIQFPSGGAIQFHEHFAKIKTAFDNSQLTDEELPAYTE